MIRKSRLTFARLGSRLQYLKQLCLVVLVLVTFTLTPPTELFADKKDCYSCKNKKAGAYCPKHDKAVQRKGKQGAIDHARECSPGKPGKGCNGCTYSQKEKKEKEKPKA